LFFPVEYLGYFAVFQKKKRIVCENIVRIQQKVRVGPTTPLTLAGVGTRQHGTAEEREREG
jgi:hypothetical protein